MTLPRSLHKFVLALAVLVLLFGFVFSLATPPACKAEQVLTPDEIVRDTELEKAIAERKAKLPPLEERAREELANLGAAQAAGDLPRVRSAVEAFEAVRAAWRAQAEEMQAKVDEQAALYQGALDREKVALAQLGQGTPAAPWLGLGATLLTPLLFKRPREHFAEGALRAIKGDFGAMVSYVAKGYGLKHSNEDPLAILDAAATVAAEKNDLELAGKLRAAHDELQAVKAAA